MPRVSVVTIFLDAERFLEEAIESVLSQQYGDWELLLIDDGSTDGCTAIAQCCAHECPDRVRYLEHPEHQNRGMSASRNLGIAHTRGEYVAFLDADDVLFPDALSRQVEILNSHPTVALTYAPLHWWYSWTGRPDDRGRDFVEELGVPSDSVIEPPKLLPRFLNDRAAVPSGVLVRQSVFERLGGFEDSFRGEYEDQVFCAKVCLHEPVFAAGAPWYRYRQHPHSSVAAGHSSGTTLSARLKFLDWLSGYLDEQGVSDRSVRAALQFEYWRYRRPRLYRSVKRGWHLSHRMRKRVAQL